MNGAINATLMNETPEHSSVCADEYNRHGYNWQKRMYCITNL